MIAPDDGLLSVDEAARRSFERAWIEGQPRPIEELLEHVAQHSFLGTLEELVHIDLEFSWRAWKSGAAAGSRANSGETVTGPPRVEMYLERFEHLREAEIVCRLVEQEVRVRRGIGDIPQLTEYRQRFPTLPIPTELFEDDQPATASTVVAGRSADRVDDDVASAPTFVPMAADAPRAARPEDERLPRAFGPYELIARLGAGGMGVVYRARQRGTERDVAVKVLRTDCLAGFARQRQMFVDRFALEARATSRLEHRGIVTIYEVGEHDGIPYYSMRFVEGTSLAEMLADGPLPQAAAARYIQAAALAVQEAHDHGILHRDLKPHNVLIERKTDEPCVADFGLAKLLEEDSVQTRTGEILGTPAYMAPEQAGGSAAVATRTDVYGLGATLYHLLTGGPPFKAATTVETLRQVVDEAPVPPRQINPTVARDLEIICLKCLEKEPAQRYASPAALADDLGHWMRGEPITARPVGRLERLLRWCRRNPAAATLGAVTAVSLMAAMAGLGTGYVQSARALERSEQSHRHARETVNEFFGIVSEDVLLRHPAMHPLRKELLERALLHYQRFLSEGGDDPSLRQEIADTHYRVGRIQELTDSSDEALASYRRAEAIHRELHREAPDDPQWVLALSTTINAMGESLSRLGRQDDALAALQEARDLREWLARLAADEPESRRLLANSVMNIGVAHRGRQDLDAARRSLTASIAMRRDLLAEREPVPPAVRRDQAMAFYNLANVETDADRLGPAEAAIDQAIRLFRELAEQTPEDFETRLRLAFCYRLRGELTFARGDFGSADEAYLLARSALENLAGENPRVVPLREELARSYLMIGELAFERQQWDQATAAFVESQQLLERLLTDERRTPQTRADLAKALQARAAVHVLRDERTAALPLLHSAVDYLQELVEEFPAGLHDGEEFRRQLQTATALIDQLGPPIP